MIDKIWVTVILTSCVLCVKNGSGASALMNSGVQAVNMMLEMMAAMTLWSGLMEQLQASGDLARLGRGIRRAVGRFFPAVKDEETWSAAGMNIAANMLGLGNAATPAGIRAAKLLSVQGEQGIRALALLLALNNSGLQLIPTTVIALRSAAGAANPADIWLPTLLSSGAATAVAAVLMLLPGRRKA